MPPSGQAFVPLETQGTKDFATIAALRHPWSADRHRSWPLSGKAFSPRGEKS